MIKAPLCRCNNCYNIYIDNNPQTNAPTFEVKQYPELKHMDDGEPFQSPDFYWGCPICETDAYLTDITNAEMIKETNLKIDLVEN